LSLSPSFFRPLVEAGDMSKPCLLGSRRIWDVDDVEAVFKALPYEGVENKDEIGEWDDLR
jgi:hypothetical protein